MIWWFVPRDSRSDKEAGGQPGSRDPKDTKLYVPRPRDRVGQPLCKREGDDASVRFWHYDSNDYDKLSIMHSSYCFSQAEFLKKAGPKTGTLSEADKYQHRLYYDKLNQKFEQ